MFKSIQLLMLLCFAQQVAASVAYLPALEPGSPIFPVSCYTNDSLFVIDLDRGVRIKKIPVGNDTGAVFVSNDGARVYAAAAADNKIALIDGESLKVVSHWDELPVSPQYLFLNEDNSKLYFNDFKLFNGGSDAHLYQIDLLSNEVSLVFDAVDSYLHGLVYSENLKYITMVVGNFNTQQYSVHTYNSSDFSLVSQASFAYVTTTSQKLSQLMAVDDAGENAYYIDRSQSRLISLKLSDGSENWSFSFPSEYFYKDVYEANETELVLGGETNPYRINKVTGVGSPLSLDDTSLSLDGKFNRLNENSMVFVDSPDWSIGGITGLGDCVISPLTVRTVNLSNHSSMIAYQSSEMNLGSVPIGRFLGAKLFRGNGAEAVPVFDDMLWLSVLVLLLLLLSWRKLRHIQ